MTPSGRFAIAYESANTSTNHDIYLSSYSNAGVLLGSVPVAVSGSSESAPSVSVDNALNAVVAYQKQVIGKSSTNDYVEARRVTGGGAVGAEITIAGGGNDAITPSVALSRTGGGFVVAYVSTPGFGDLFSPTDYTTEVNASDKITGTFTVGKSRIAPSVSIDGSNNYLVTDSGQNNPYLASNSAYARFGHL
jgi:hypothetical protein